MQIDIPRNAAARRSRSAYSDPRVTGIRPGFIHPAHRPLAPWLNRVVTFVLFPASLLLVAGVIYALGAGMHQLWVLAHG
jgi:hypothetical protein